MSFVRASFRARSILAGARRYNSTAPPTPKKSSNLPLALAAAGAAGLGAYVYLDRSGKPEVKAKKQQEKSPLDPENFVDFELKKIVPYNHNTATYIFELPGGEASLLPVASCVVVKSASDSPAPLLGNNEKPIIRPYTPTSAPDLEGELHFLIKRYEAGKMSQHIHNLKPGEKLGIKGPIVKIPYKANEFEEVGMIAGGSGITPMFQVLNHALGDPNNKTKFTLIFANVTPKDILLKDEFDALKAKHPDTLNIIYTVDKPDGSWNGTVGYVNKTLVQQHIPPPSLAEKVKIFVCGPPGQVNAIAGKKDGMKQGPVGGLLKELGYSEDQVFKF